jgi:alpha-1,6-mannosyltransferase
MTPIARSEVARAAMTDTILGLCACGLALVLLALPAWHGQWTDNFDLFVPAAFAQGAAYALAAWLLTREYATGKSAFVPPLHEGVAVEKEPGIDRRRLANSNHTVLMVIFGVAVMLRAVAFATPPNFLSTDVYRYIWDGRVQAAGINPYIYVPADPALEALEDEAVYSHINRAESARTIYAPFAQLVFLAATRFGQSVATMRIVMLAFEIVAVVALGLLLARLRQPLEWLMLYLWHPLPVWEIACGAHVDAVLTAMVLLALLAAVEGARARSGVLLALATFTKFFPMVIAPALWRRFDWRMPAAFAATATLLYAPYLGAGSKVFGYLLGYAAEERLSNGDAVFGIALLRRIGLPGSSAALVYGALAAMVLGWLTLKALSASTSENDEAINASHERQRSRDPASLPALAGALATATMVLLSPHYPWYFVWLVPFIAIKPRASLIWLTVAAFALYVTDWPLTLEQGLFIYAPYLALLMLEWRIPFRSPPQKGALS